MKRMMICAIVFVGMMVPAFAQSDWSNDDWSSWDKWAHAHKGTYSELRNKPERASSQKFIDRHPDLRRFYDEHPGARAYLQSHPDWTKHGPSFDRDRTQNEH